MKPTALQHKRAAEMFKELHRLRKPECGLGRRNSYGNKRSVKIVEVVREKERERQD